jgi:hypothetical protein
VFSSPGEQARSGSDPRAEHWIALGDAMAVALAPAVTATAVATRAVAKALTLPPEGA